MREIPFEKENLQIFENETEIYKGDFEKKMACLTAMEMSQMHLPNLQVKRMDIL